MLTKWFLSPFVLVIGIGLIQGDANAQAGCTLIDSTQPAQSLLFERADEVGTTNSSDRKTNVLLRFRNNTNCDVTLLSFYPPPESRKIEVVKKPDGTRRVTFSDKDLPDGVSVDVNYHLEYWHPLPPPKKTYATDETVTEIRVIAGRSILIAIPLTIFDRWLNVEVPFRFDWDSSMYHPTHQVIFSNADLPLEVFRRTKLCTKVDWCNKR